MGLFDAVFNPLTLAGASQGLLQGREAQIAQGNVEADRQVKQQIATTDALRAKNEALAPYRTELARQLQVHDQYRPYHQAGLMQQYGTSDPNDPRVQGDMATWEQTMDPYRQALATDDPDQVRQIIQAGVQKHGSLPPVVTPPSQTQTPTEAPAPATPSLTNPWDALIQNGKTRPMGLGPAIAGAFAPPDPLALIQNGVEIPEDSKTPADGHYYTPPRGGSPVWIPAPAGPSPAPTPVGGHYYTPPRGGHAVWVPEYAPAPAPMSDRERQEFQAIYQSLFGDQSADILPQSFTAPGAAKPAAAAADTTDAPKAPAIPSLPPAMALPAAVLTPTPSRTDPTLALHLPGLENQQLTFLQQHPLGLIGPTPAAPPLVPSVGTPNPQAPTSPNASAPTPTPYDPTHPNPSPGPVAGLAGAGSQNPSVAAGAPFIAQGADGTPVLRVPGVGDVPVVTAQRVLDQAKADPAVIAAQSFMTHMNLVASLGPGVDPQVLDKADSAYQTAWSGAIDKYSALDKLPTDQLNTLQTAAATLLTAQTGAQKAPAEIALNLANAAKAREETRLLLPKARQDEQESIVRNLGMFHTMGLNDAQQQEAIAHAAQADAQKLNLPAETRIKYIDAVMRGTAERIKADAYQKAYASSDQGTADLAYIQKNDGIMANAFSNLGGNGAPFNTLQAWIVIKRAETDPKDEVYQRAKAGALQVLQAATASYYGGHPELVNGPVPAVSAWTGRDLWDKLGPNALAPFLNKNDSASKQTVEALRSWRSFAQMMQGGGDGTYAKSLGEPGFFTRWVNGVQRTWKRYQENNPGPFSAWGQPDQIRSFIPPAPARTVAPAQPQKAPPPNPGAPYPPSSTAPSP